MDDREIVFLEVMGGIAVVGLIAFLIYLVARYAGAAGAPGGPGGEGPPAGYVPKWYELLLAAILLLAVAIVVVWQFPPFGGEAAGDADWRAESRSLIFFVVMLVVAGLGFVAFLALLFARIARQPQGEASGSAFAGPPPAAGGAASDEAAATAAQAQPVPSGARLLGLLLLAFGYLLVNWIYVPAAQQYTMMLSLMYPAGLAVALVLLFDKATRAWSTKGAAESVREWLLCDGIVVLFILGFLNLLQSGAGDKYAAMHWDLLNLVLFFVAFWIVDRQTTRYRFLVAYLYLILLPILLLIWRSAQGVVAPEGLSWWSTIWPFFGLAIIFFVLEIIALIAARDSNKHAVPAVKDALFVVLYGILLIGAIPAVAE